MESGPKIDYYAAEFEGYFYGLNGALSDLPHPDTVMREVTDYELADFLSEKFRVISGFSNSFDTNNVTNMNMVRARF